SSGLDPGPAKSARGAVPVFRPGPFPRAASLTRRAHYLATAPDLAPEYLASKRPEKPPLVLVIGTSEIAFVWPLVNDCAISAAVASDLNNELRMLVPKMRDIVYLRKLHIPVIGVTAAAVPHYGVCSRGRASA